MNSPASRRLAPLSSRTLRPLLALAVGALGAGSGLAQPAFDDLASVQGTGDGYSTPGAQAVDDGGVLGTRSHPSAAWTEVQGELKQAAPLLERALESYGKLVVVSPKQTDGGNDKYFFKDLGKYRQAVRFADALDEDLAKAGELLTAMAPRIDAAEADIEPAWALELRAEHTRQITLFNQLYDWGSARELKYDTISWGDEQRRPVLPSGYMLKRLTMPSSTGVREGSYLARSLTEPQADRYIRSAEAQVALAKAEYDILEREHQVPSGGKERESLTGWIYYDYSTESLFDVHIKPSAVRFAAAMLRAKADLNAALLLTEAPTNNFSEANHNDLRRALMNYSRLATWGDHRYLRVLSSWGFVLRALYVFDGSKFRNSYRVRTGGIESEYYDDVIEYMRKRAS